MDKDIYSIRIGYEKSKENQEYMVVRDAAINDVLKSLTDKKIKNCNLN